VDFKLYKDVQEFNNDIYSQLMRDEAANIMFLGDLAVGLAVKECAKQGWKDTSKWYMATVKDSGNCVLAALMVPGDKLQLCAFEDFTNNTAQAVELLVKELINTDISVEGVYTQAVLGLAFAEAYADFTKIKYEVKEERSYLLNAINQSTQTRGAFRLAEKKDLSFIPYWREDFFAAHKTSGQNISEDLSGYEGMIDAENLYMLEVDGVAVSMGRIDQRAENVCGLGLIYTPPYFRNKGYGTAITAHISKICLDEGYICTLTADLSNPVSNSIYQKMGYRPLCDMVSITFENIVNKL